MREGKPLKVETEVNVDLKTLVESRNPAISKKDKEVATNNIKKLLSHLTYVVIDPAFSEEKDVEVKLRLDQNNYKVIVKTKEEELFQENLQGPFVHVKFGSNFSNHQFFWDDIIVAWLMADLFPELSRSTIDFWYRLQIREGKYKGLIPREIRPESFAKNIDTTAYSNIVNPVLFIPPTSLQVSNPFLLSEVELELYKAYKDKERLEKVYPLLKSYFYWVEQDRKKVDEDTKCVYYEFSNLGSGMDNIMRGYGLFNPELRNYGWVDLFSQQLFLAQDLEKMEEILGI